ncbi:hypothetical protein CONPUDRAFT_66102, partial [Coniophora puteana RWD-64-598 SS2]
NSLFACQVSIFIADEMHIVRKPNLIHLGVRAITEWCLESGCFIGMTATPAINKAQDLWYIAAIMKIADAASEGTFVEMNKELQRANREEGKRLKKENKNTTATFLAGGPTREDDAVNLYLPTMMKWVREARRWFQPFVIRRTIDSLDNNGNPISGLEPYTTQIIELQMYRHERKNVRRIANALAQKKTKAGNVSHVSNHHLYLSCLRIVVYCDSTHGRSRGGRRGTPPSCACFTNFYLEFRRSLLHPAMNSGEWNPPETREEWLSASVKLDILAKIADYHLEDDGREPLVHGTDRRSVVVPEDIRMSSPPPTDATSAASEIQFCNSPTDEDGPVNLGGASPSKPDKIVVFSYFPSSNFAIQAVLALYGIKTLVLHGGHQPPQRAAILREFRESGREGPRVLILSSAGAVGLNIDCANLMIIMDTLWSGLEDEQLRGRIWRYPQSKHVVFYRLVALDTPDVFLNTISFNKARIHDAFTNADPAISKHSSSVFFLCSYYTCRKNVPHRA